MRNVTVKMEDGSIQVLKIDNSKCKLPDGEIKKNFFGNEVVAVANSQNLIVHPKFK